MRRSIAILVLLSAGLSGCAVHELHSDQDKIRCSLLDLYTNQIMDNLIRAHNKMPIIQVDYANATATVTAKEMSSLGDMLVATHTNALTTAAMRVLALTNTTVNTLTTGGSLDHTNQVSVIASPVTASDAVYDAYEAFLAIDGSLNMTCEPPPPGTAHLCKRCGKNYYWVPVGYEREFLRLALATTAQRGGSATPADPFYSVNFLQVLKQELISNSTNKDGVSNYWLTIKIDKRIPVDDGVADISSKNPQPAPAGGGPAKKSPAAGGTDKTSVEGDPANATQAKGAAQTGNLAIFPVDTGDSKGGRSQTTNLLRVLFQGTSPPTGYKTVEALSAAINSQPLPAKIYLYRHRPQTPTPSDSNSRIEFYLQQIQQGQLRGAGLP
jgi:hypothetical protein